jgi:hypothetical protein
MDFRSMNFHGIIPEHLSFPHDWPKRTPDGSSPIYVDTSDKTISAQPLVIGGFPMRVLNAGLYRFACEVISSGHEGMVKIETDALYDRVVPKDYRNMISRLSMGKVISANLLYSPYKRTRKRSGGRDPLTGKNKQVAIDPTYRFWTTNDLKIAMEFQMAIWLPWYARAKEKEMTFSDEDFERWLEFIRIEPPETLHSDLLTFESKALADDEEELPSASAEKSGNPFIAQNQAEKEWLRGFADRDEKGNPTNRMTNPPTPDDWIRMRRRGKDGFDEWGYPV